jgi:hypothetical protein
MRRGHFVALVIAALLAGTAGAFAQGFADNPPGWAFQKRGIIESEGYSPLNYGWRYRHWRYRHWRGGHAWGYVHHRWHHHRYHYRHW